MSHVFWSNHKNAKFALSLTYAVAVNGRVMSLGQDSSITYTGNLTDLCRASMNKTSSIFFKKLKDSLDHL